MEKKLEGLHARNTMISTKLDKIKEHRAKKANEEEIQKLQLLNEAIKRGRVDSSIIKSHVHR